MKERERGGERKNEKREKREKSFPGTSISLKSAQRERRAAVPVVQMATPNSRARSLKENIFIKFMRPRRRFARAPVNRFPEDVDQFRLERRRGMEERKRGREKERGKGSRSLSRTSEREKTFLSPSTALHHRLPFFLFLLLPPSIRRSTPIPRPPLSFFFSSRRKKCALRA